MESLQIWYVGNPSFIPCSIADHTQKKYTFQRILIEMYREVSFGISLLNLHQAEQHLAAITLSQPPGPTENVSQVAKSWHQSLSTVYLQVGRVTVDRPRQSSASGADVFSVDYKPAWYSAGFLVNPHSALRADNGVASTTFTTDSTKVLPRVLEEIKPDAWDEELCLFYNDSQTLLSISIFQILSLAMHSLSVSAVIIWSSA